MPTYIFKLVVLTVLTSESANVSDFSPYIILYLVDIEFVSSKLL